MKDTFQNWKLDKCIGSGAFGKVYRIVRTEFGYTYEAALKVLEIPQHFSEVETIRREGMSEKEISKYFESVVEDIVKEFTLMSKLKGNSHIVSYEDHEVVRKKDSFGWEIYIRMELLTPLYTYMEQHQMEVSDVIKMGIHLCKALELCERHHIIHRDIKPENIFISNNGDFKLGDFGIARELEKTSCDLSQKGTKSYMAPEVYKGMEYNFSVDIYSLGVVLYRFLNNNRLPFYPGASNPIRYSDKEEATLLRMGGKEMPNPCNASDELANIILKACAYIPSERYGSAKEMREALESIYQSEYAMADQEETLYINPNENMQNINNEERTVEIFPREENEDSLSYNHYQEESIWLERKALEKTRSTFLENQQSILEEKPMKKKNKVYAGIVIGCLCMAAIIMEIWAKKQSEQIGMVEEMALATNIVSGTSAITSINLMPNTVDMKWKEAKKALESIGLHVKVKKQYNSSLEKGIVIQQSIEAGTNVEDGEQIVLVVSKGKKPQPTPKPTENPTPVPTEKSVWKPTQQTEITSENNSETGNTTEESSSWKPDENEVQQWNPNE